MIEFVIMLPTVCLCFCSGSLSSPLLMGCMYIVLNLGHVIHLSNQGEGVIIGSGRQGEAGRT